VPTEDKFFLSFNMYFLVFYNIHDHDFLELNYSYHCCADCGEISTLLSLFLILLLLILCLILCTSIHKTINLVFLIRLNFVL
jgi:hypothetical protein